MINADKPELWEQDIRESVILFNRWFTEFAPKAFRDARSGAVQQVTRALKATADLTIVNAAILREHPGILPVLRMCTCPPIARDRLIGLANVNRNMVGAMEAKGRIAARMAPAELDEQLARIARTISEMRDVDVFPWLSSGARPGRQEIRLAATIAADRLCGAIADPIVRNAQERRQLAAIAAYLEDKGYLESPAQERAGLQEMMPGTFSFRRNVAVGTANPINIPIDVVVQPMRPGPAHLPVLIEAKSAGDFTNVNKRRKEEATKMRQLRERYGREIKFILFLCGYFDIGYLSYEADEGIDWVWEHRIRDLGQLGL